MMTGEAWRGWALCCVRFTGHTVGKKWDGAEPQSSAPSRHTIRVSDFVRSDRENQLHPAAC